MTEKELPSGIYQCMNCKASKVIHFKGGNFAPCTQCKSNSRWQLLLQVKHKTNRQPINIYKTGQKEHLEKG